MANGTDSDEYVLLPRIRPGLKRELALALKSQSESAGSIGRTRSRRSQNGSLNDEVSENPINKRFKSSGSKERENKEEKSATEDKAVTDIIGDDSEKVILVSEDEEPKSDVVDFTSDDERKSSLGESAMMEKEPKDDVEKPYIDFVESKCEELFESEDQAKKSDKDQFSKNLILKMAEVKSPYKAMVEEKPNVDFVETMGEQPLEHVDEVKKSDKDSNNDILEIVEVKPSSKGEDAVGGLFLAGEGIVDNANTENPPRQITCSALELKGAPSEIFGLEDVKTKEVAESDVMSSLVSPLNKIEMKMSRKIVLKRFPTKLKELLETGLLEGLPVRYLRSSKVREESDMGLGGMIKGSGILCCCNMCDGTEVVTPNKFEVHAGSANRRPQEYIYLENGNTLCDVLNACKDVPPDALEVTIQNAIGCSFAIKPTFCLNCKGLIPEAGNCKTMLLCNSCMVLEEFEHVSAQPNDTSNRSPLSVSAPKSSERVSHCSSSRSKGRGRLTRKDVRMHKLVFEEDVLADGTALAYYARGQKLLEGYKKGFGIFCFCCNSEVSPSQFEAHAGWASRRKPYLYIYTSNGVSLHELSIGLSKQRKFSADENDDLCSICADGGDLLLCDNCPRAFHNECVFLPSIPQGTWYCKYCQNMFQKEKFVERNVNAVAAGRVAGIDPIEQITKRCIRVVETMEAEVDGCVLCRSQDFSKSGFCTRTVIICDQCEKEYHVGCLKEQKTHDLKELPTGKWFCCTDCNRIHSALQKLVADGEEKLPDSLLNVIKKTHGEQGSNGSVDLVLRWRLLCGKMSSEDSRLLLSNAVAIFHDQFDPIADSNTSRLDLIPPMVYGRNLRDQDFGGMYCAILTVNSTIVSAGIIRIFGQEVAELPLVATSSDFQGQGYFWSLFSCIENVLRSLNVRNLVLPAADEAESMWIKKFGFEKINEDQLKQYRRYHQMMIFQGTSMLHKSITKS